jgi:hypothetical protein
LLVCPDPRIVTACLRGLENFLKVGEAEKSFGNTGYVNLYAQMIDDAGGLEKIKNLQSHDDSKIYEKAVKILKSFESNNLPVPSIIEPPPVSQPEPEQQNSEPNSSIILVQQSQSENVDKTLTTNPPINQQFQDY